MSENPNTLLVEHEVHVQRAPGGLSRRAVLVIASPPAWSRRLATGW